MKNDKTRFIDFLAGLPHIEFSEMLLREEADQYGTSDRRQQLLRSLVYRPNMFRRNDVGWIAVHAWRPGAKERGIAALRNLKRQLDMDFIREAAEPIASLIRQLLGPIPANAVTSVPCGHSRRTDCFSKRLAHAVGVSLGIPWIQVFADRPMPGSSHPRTSTRLPPLQQIGSIPSSVIVVDDVATSGYHLEEIVLALRQLNSTASAFAWISGSSAKGQPIEGFELSSRQADPRRFLLPRNSPRPINPATWIS